MRPNFCLTILHVFILAATLLTLEDSEDECEVQIRVSRNKKYNALLGEELQIECPVNFCNNSPPTISWSKLEETNVPVNVSPGSGFRTEWKTLKDLNGVFVLIIQNFVRNDSGVYQCQSGSTKGHKINVSVNEINEKPTEAGMTTEPRSPETGEPLWPTVYRVGGIMGLVIIVILVYVTSDSICKCVRGRSKETPDPSSQPSNKAEPTDHDYENIH